MFRYWVNTTQFTNLQILWTPGKNMAFPDLWSRNVPLRDLNGHQLSHKEFPEDIRFFNQNGHEVQYFNDHSSSTDVEMTIFISLSAYNWVKKALHLKIDGIDMTCTIFDSKSPKALSNVSDSLEEGKNFNKRRKRQSPSIVVEAEVHEHCYSEFEFYSEISDNEASDDDLAFNQEIEDSQKTNLNSTPSIFLYTNQTRQWNWQLTLWILITSWWMKIVIQFWKLCVWKAK